MPKLDNKEYVDVSNIVIRPISKNTAKDIIEKNHYSHTFSSCRYALGVFFLKENTLFEGLTEELIGCMSYGYPVGRLAAQSISDLLEPNQVLELTRLFVADGYGTNTESYSIAQSFKWLRENDKNIKALVSYADPQVGHLGKIYQSTNWKYQGDNLRLVDAYSLKYKLDDPLWIHSRTVFSMYGSNNVDVLKSKIGKTFWLKLEERKHRYIYFLTGKKETNKILKSLKHPIIPYPKNIKNITEQITEVTI